MKPRKKKPRKRVESEPNANPSADPGTLETDSPEASIVPSTMTATSTFEENTIDQSPLEDKSHAESISGDQRTSPDAAVQCSSTQFSAKFSFYPNKEAESVGKHFCLWFLLETVSKKPFYKRLFFCLLVSNQFVFIDNFGLVLAFSGITYAQRLTWNWVLWFFFHLVARRIARRDAPPEPTTEEEESSSETGVYGYIS